MARSFLTTTAIVLFAAAFATVNFVPGSKPDPDGMLPTEWYQGWPMRWIEHGATYPLLSSVAGDSDSVPQFHPDYKMILWGAKFSRLGVAIDLLFAVVVIGGAACQVFRSNVKATAVILSMAVAAVYGVSIVFSARTAALLFLSVPIGLAFVSVLNLAVLTLKVNWRQA